MSRVFVLLGQKAIPSPEFSLDDVPGTSGRLDVLLRAARAALLVSHGIRRDTVVYLVLGGGDDTRHPRTVRLTGANVEFIRPDERNLAALVKKTLAAILTFPTPTTFVDFRQGVAIANDGLTAVLEDLPPAGAVPRYILDERGADVRDAKLGPEGVFFVGDHLGFAPDARAALAASGLAETAALRVGPVSLHADDAVAIVGNELDRAQAPNS